LVGLLKKDNKISCEILKKTEIQNSYSLYHRVITIKKQDIGLIITDYKGSEYIH